MYWGTSYGNQFYQKQEASVKDVPGEYKKFKIRPSEPVLNDYGKTLEIDAYMKRIQSYKKSQPDHIIFRNTNLARDIKVEVNKLEGKNRSVQFEKDMGLTMSSFKPLEKRVPPRNIS